MTDLSADRPPAVRPGRAKARPSAMIVTATALGEHLGLSRQRITRLADDNVIARLSDGQFDQDACRLLYLAWLRDPARRSARSEAASAFTRAKTRLIELRVLEREGVLMETAEAIETVKDIMGTLRTHLSGLAAQCSRDLPTRRAVESAVNAMLHRVADEAARRAGEFGKPSKTIIDVVDHDDAND